MAEAGQRIESLVKDQEQLRKRTQELANRKDAKDRKQELEEWAREQSALYEKLYGKKWPF